jgi:hypothetical protein
MRRARDDGKDCATASRTTASGSREVGELASTALDKAFRENPHPMPRLEAQKTLGMLLEHFPEMHRLRSLYPRVPWEFARGMERPAGK